MESNSKIVFERRSKLKRKQFLAAILLGVVLCFVISGVGYGEIGKSVFEEKAPLIQVSLLRSLVRYMMRNPTSFLDVRFGYLSDPDIILLYIYDNRNRFSYKSGVALLDTFKRNLEIIYSFILISSDMDADVWAWFYSREGIELGYFLDGKYHLSEGIDKKGGL